MVKAKTLAKPEVKMLWLKELKPNPENPREISEPAFEGLRKSLEHFGYVDLLVVNKRNHEIVSGHQRYRILQDKGVTSVLCVLVDVDAVRQRAMSISLNNRQIMGEWTAALVPQLEQLRREIPEDYIDLRLDELREDVLAFEEENMGAGNTLPDDIPDPPKVPRARPGDLWILGQHRLLCGDSTKPEDVRRLMGDEKASLFATDPPYCVDYTGADRPMARGSRAGGKDWSNVYREYEIKDAGAFYESYLHIGLKHCEKNVPVYMWHATKRFSEIAKLWEKIGLLLHQPIIWVKPCSVMSYSVYSWRHEPCLFGWPKGERPRCRARLKGIGSVWTVDLLRSGDPQSADYYSDICELTWEGNKRPRAKDHPTVKPTEVFCIPMRIHTRPGEICYEPFSGSGTQIISAERLNRRCFAIEKEPVFVDVAIRRWEEFTGKKAKREGEHDK